MPRASSASRTGGRKASPETSALVNEGSLMPSSSAFSSRMRRKDGVPT
jgi:hypothetical protein